MIEQTCKLFPQIRDHIDLKIIGSPVTNHYYLGQTMGANYGLDHSLERFEPLMAAKLRPETDIPGTYIHILILHDILGHYWTSSQTY